MPFYCCLLFLGSSCVTAQPSKAASNFSKKDTKTILAVRSAMDLGNYSEVIPSLNALIAKYPEGKDLRYLRAISHKELGQLQAAITDFQAGFAQDGSPRAQLELGEIYALNGQFDQSLAAYSEYLRLVKTRNRPQQVDRAQKLVDQAKVAANIASERVPFSPVPLPGGVNTDEHLEYFPALSIDGRRMVFTRRVNGQQEDFYVSEIRPDGSWAEASPLETLNTSFDEGAQTITADGKYMVFTQCNRPGGAGSCDLVFSVLREGRWTRPEPLGRNVNTAAYEAQPSISPDGQLLFFASNRPGGRGKTDLYVSGRTADDGWSAPINLGPSINTGGQDQYPFWAADGKTLFFTSDGHPGLGGEDLFRAELRADNTWSSPTNLGYPINTAANETNLFIGLNGSTAYFSKREVDPLTGENDVDIYQFELPEESRPAPVTYLKARVINAISREPLPATVRLKPLAGDAPERRVLTSGEGEIITMLPAGEDYALTVNQEGFLFYSDRFSLAGGLVTEEPYELLIELEPVSEAVATGEEEEDGAIAFKNVLFATGSATLLPVSGQELDRIVELLAADESIRIEIAGHTDDVGSAEDNLLLSRRRAQSVKQYLSSRGIAPERIITMGYGESQPIASNDTEAGRAKNRRTTFRLR